MENNRIIFHVDVNNAFLSWEAAYRLQIGANIDLRKIPSAVCGDEKKRHGIVLAKSLPAKKLEIHTGEPIFAARKKCRNLFTVQPDYDLYIKAGSSLMDILTRYTPEVQRFSIDECFLDLTGNHDYINTAYEIKNTIKKELGFTVNIGISSNKLLAKMASDFKKPDMIHTLFPWEIKEKMWPLPAQNLFMIGRASIKELHMLNIFTIGDLANYDINILQKHFKSYGKIMHDYANGIEDSEINQNTKIKSIGNSTTTPFDICDSDTAKLIILSLSEMVGMRLRKSKNCCKVISIGIKGADFCSSSKQSSLHFVTDSTQVIFNTSYELFKKVWGKNPLRYFRISVSELSSDKIVQTTFLERDLNKLNSIDKAIDSIRDAYGTNSVFRCSFLNSGIKPLSSGRECSSYPVMSSRL